MFLGLRTVIYPAPDLAASKAWYTALLGVEPYFDEPFYVGFDVGGYELGLHPDDRRRRDLLGRRGRRRGARGAARRRRDRALSRDRCRASGIRVATVLEPAGSVLGIIENPHFQGGS